MSVGRSRTLKPSRRPTSASNPKRPLLSLIAAAKASTLLRFDVSDEICDFGACKRQIWHTRMLRRRQEKPQTRFIKAFGLPDLRKWRNRIRSGYLPRCNHVAFVAPSGGDGAPAGKICCDAWAPQQQCNNRSKFQGSRCQQARRHHIVACAAMFSTTRLSSSCRRFAVFRIEAVPMSASRAPSLK